MTDEWLSLPDDVAELKAMMHSMRRHYEGELAKQAAHIKANEQKVFELQAHIRKLLAARFGSRSEQVIDGQLGLFNEAELEADNAPGEEQPSDDSVAVSPHRRRRGKRRPLPPNLPRMDIVHDLPEAEKLCPHDGTTLELIGETLCEQLDIIPAKLRVLVHKRLKYACPCCRRHHRGHIKTAPLAPQPIPKSQASAGLLAYVATAKFVDALPLYRQSAQFARIGVDMPRQTLARWMVRVGNDLVRPLINVLRDEMLSQSYLQMDETTFQVLKEPGKAPQSKSQLWVQRAMHPQRPVVLFSYRAARCSDTAAELLGDFKGVLQTDLYAGYHGPGQAPGIVHIFCFAHARRFFTDGLKAIGINPQRIPPKPPPQARRLLKALSFIRGLYAIERRIRGKTPEERLAARQAHSTVALERFEAWVRETRPKALPSGDLGKGLRYIEDHWDGLTYFTVDGRVEIDTNLTEGEIRPFAIGRNNWKFADTMAGADASAAIYSLVVTAKANGLEPYAYLRHVITHLPAAIGLADIEALLPWNLNPEMIAPT